MAILYWRGSAAYNGGDWNVAANWYTPYIFGATGSAPITVLIPAGRTPYANDSVKILNALPFPITGTVVSNTPILANCSTGGMSNLASAGGLTYNWAGAPAGASYGPLASLEIGISAAPAAGYTYTHFTFNPDGSIPLFWKNASEVLTVDESWMPGTASTNSYWTSKLYGILNPGYGATAHNKVDSFVYGFSPDLNNLNYYNKLDLSLKGKIGKFQIPPSLSSGHFFYGDVTVEPNTTVNVMEIRGEPTNVLIPTGCTCSSLVIETEALFGGDFTTNIHVQCSVGITTNQYSSASANDYGPNNFLGIKHRDYEGSQYGSTVVNIGYPIGSTAPTGSPTTLYYNLWEDTNSLEVGGSQSTVFRVQGSCFINDMVFEYGRFEISPQCNPIDPLIIKKGELRGFSVLDLRKTIEYVDGFTLGVPTILGPFAAANRGQTGAEGVLISSRYADFFPHFSTTISFT